MGDRCKFTSARNIVFGFRAEPFGPECVNLAGFFHVGQRRVDRLDERGFPFPQAERAGILVQTLKGLIERDLILYTKLIQEIGMRSE